MSRSAHKPDRVPARRSALAGYYNPLDGSRYISPFVSGTKFPDLVQLHESNHQYLALANMTDALAQLYSHVVNLGAGHLSEAHTALIRELFETIHTHSAFTHEVVATHSSYRLFANQFPEQLAQARKELPKEYREFLKVGEAAFGRVSDRHLKETLTGGTTLLACAIAALSLPYDLTDSRFENLPATIAYIRKNSPDRRFRKFLTKVTPWWKPGSIFPRVGEIEDAFELQNYVFEQLRKNFPAIAFRTHKERPTMFREWVADHIQSAHAHGYTFMDGFGVAPHPGEEFEKHVGTRIVLPGLPDHMPLDLALTLPYNSPVSLQKFEAVARSCSPQVGGCLFCHAMVAPDSGEVVLACFTMAVVDRQMGAVTTFMAQGDLEEFLARLNRLPRGSLMIKIDERWAFPVVDRIVVTGHMPFILAHDTTPAHVVSLLKQIGRNGPVNYRHFHLRNQRFWVLLGLDAKRTMCLVTPVTLLDARMIKFHAGTDFVVGEKPIWEMLQVEELNLQIMLRTCYEGR